jgi:hypothetical protein
MLEIKAGSSQFFRLFKLIRRDKMEELTTEYAEQKLKSVLERVVESNKMINDLAKELGAAKRLLWTTIHINGGEVRIPDDVFMRTENNQELECFYDKEKHETVLRAKISIPEFKASANVPGKA